LRDLGPHLYHPGDRVGRWTVIRHAGPAQQPHGGNRLVWRHRVIVKCACGLRGIAFEYRLRKGRCLGCRSMTCINAVRLRSEIAKWEADREYVIRMRGAVSSTTDAHARIARARERLDALTSNLRDRPWR
jgi:hypothetical protein